MTDEIYTYKTAKDLNKKEQIVIIKKLGVKTSPRYEDGRIKLIIKLQDEKLNKKNKKRK